MRATSEDVGLSEEAAAQESFVEYPPPLLVVAAELVRYGDAKAGGWADVIDIFTCYPEARRQAVRLLGELGAVTTENEGGSASPTLATMRPAAARVMGSVALAAPAVRGSFTVGDSLDRGWRRRVRHRMEAFLERVEAQRKTEGRPRVGDVPLLRIVDTGPHGAPAGVMGQAVEGRHEERTKEPLVIDIGIIEQPE